LGKEHSSLEEVELEVFKAEAGGFTGEPIFFGLVTFFEVEGLALRTQIQGGKWWCGGVRVGGD